MNDTIARVTSDFPYEHWITKAVRDCSTRRGLRDVMTGNRHFYVIRHADEEERFKPRPFGDGVPNRWVGLFETKAEEHGYYGA